MTFSDVFLPVPFLAPPVGLHRCQGLVDAGVFKWGCPDLGSSVLICPFDPFDRMSEKVGGLSLRG